MNEKYPVMNIHDAVTKIKELCWAKFDETIDLSLNMGLDPRKPNQSVKGVAKLPSGSGKVSRVLVFASGTDAQEALDAGADVVGSDELVALIQGGQTNFNTVIATPNMMGLVGRVGKILGPRGLMPNPKLGTVTKDVGNAVRSAKAGSAKFKVEKKGIIHVAVGKKSFTDEMLIENIRSVMLAVMDAKPEGLKGKYLQSVHLSSTMGPGLTIDLPSIDPSNGRFMLNIDGV